MTTPEDEARLSHYVETLLAVMNACPIKGGVDGTMPCPVCTTGTIHYRRVANKRRHLRAYCDAPDCFQVLE